jgi:hypothetical protein
MDNLVMQLSPASCHFSLLGPSSHFSNTLNLCSSLSVTAQVSHSHAKQHTQLYFYICICREHMGKQKILNRTLASIPQKVFYL